tara:strand:- start:1641 stop:2057 length:417 start_codon:yes stop_codon:yes gene_type:complete
MSNNSYVNCPKCNASIYEKNLSRHMSSSRCIKGDADTMNLTNNKSVIAMLTEKNKKYEEELLRCRHELQYAERMFIRLLKEVKKIKASGNGVSVPNEGEHGVPDTLINKDNDILLDNNFSMKYDKSSQTDTVIHQIKF